MRRSGLRQFHNLIKILALRALAHAAQGEAEIALATLSRALDLAAPEGYIRTFVDHGRPMQQLLSKLLAAQRSGQPAARRGIETAEVFKTSAVYLPDYVAKLLATFPDLQYYL